MKTYGVVLVGCGYMGAAHLDEIYYRDNIVIRGVVDLDLARANDFVRKYGAQSCNTDYRAYLQDPSVDIFIISTYPDTHLMILRDCLANGKHVLCEKPIAGTLEESQEFVRLAKQSDAKVLVGHILRHNSTYNKVQEMICNGAIGSPIVMRMVQNKHIKEWSRHLELIENTSPIVDCGVHYIDIMQWFTGARIKSISGISSALEPNIPEGKYNYGMFTARLSDGSIGYYEAGWGNTIASEDVKEFIGPKGRIRIVYGKDRNWHREEGDLIEYYQWPENEYRIINNDAKRKPTWDQLQHLLHMIEGECNAVPTMDEVFEAFKIALAADEAVKTGKNIEL
jgi:Predicted dehydrogenases and related proteins